MLGNSAAPARVILQGYWKHGQGNMGYSVDKSESSGQRTSILFWLLCNIQLVTLRGAPPPERPAVRYASITCLGRPWAPITPCVNQIA